MENLLSPPEPQGESLKLGILLTVIQVVVYLAFILSNAYAPAFMARDFLSTGVPVSFVFGLTVIGMGILLTVLYVTITNMRERAA